MILFLKYNKQNLKIDKEKIQIGRSKNNDIIIYDKFVSREHCRIRIKNKSIIIEDLQSSNGTFVATDGGDILKIGAMGEFEIREGKKPAKIYLGNSDLGIIYPSSEKQGSAQKTMIYKTVQQQKRITKPSEVILLNEKNVYMIGKINPEAGAVAIRRLLEEFLYSYTHIDSDLYELIDAISDKENVTREMVNMMHYIRVTGNNGAHRGHRVSWNALSKAIDHFGKIKKTLTS